MKKILILYLIQLVLISNSYTQDKGSLSGIVRDKISQSLLQGITVKVLGSDLKTVTIEDGSYKIDNIPAGKYEVEFSNVAYQTYIESDVMIASGMEKRLIIEIDEISVDEVIVETSRFQKPIDATTSYKTLNSEEIRKSPGSFEDVGRVIQTLPGLSLTNDGRNDILVRGGSQSENLFIVDGFQVNNFNHFGTQGATGGPISIINLDFVNKIEFLTGGFSAKYGDKLSSVVLVELRDGNPDHFFGKINISGTGIGANLEGPFPFKNKGSWLFSARRSYLDLVFNAAGFSFIPEYTDIQLNLNYNVNNSNFLEFTAFGAIDKVRFNNDNQENKQNNERILTTNQNSYSSGLIWKTILSPVSYAKFTLGRNYTTYFYSKRDSLFNETFRSDSKESDITLKAELYGRFKKNTFYSAGSGMQTIKLIYDIEKDADTTLVIDPQTGQNIIIPGVIIDKNERTYKAFAYAEIIHTFFDRVKLTAGIRYDYFDYIKNKHNISPRTSLSLKISEKVSLNLAYGRFYQSPSYIWLVGAEGNRNLKNIGVDHFIAGIEFFPDKSSKLTIEGYYKKYKYYPVSLVRPYLILANSTIFETQNSFGLEQLSSDGKGRSYGLEIFYQKPLTDNFYGSASLSLGTAKYTALDGVERPSDYDNRFVFNVTAGWLPGKNWEFSMKFRIAGGTPYTPIDPETGNIIISEYNTERLPVYHRLDIRGEKRFSFSKWSLITYIDIQNVYNKQNVFQYRWDPFKKEIVTSKNLGILPTVGIMAEF